MSEINFFSEDIEFSFQQPKKASEWLIQIASQHQKSIGFINYVFCSDRYLHQLNVEYLQHDTLTDIITFP
ncbi:MAG: rRNA maturation factor, partial [Saprospiraceae bacterium]|nr:rRNA maturation factor [Saprospiraceae bacterium]